MKLAHCARCGDPIMVAESYKIDVDMEVCSRCDAELYADYLARHPEEIDTENL